MASKFEPFRDDVDAPGIGGMTIENGEDRISMSGSLDIAKDQRGLDQARALHDLLGAIVTALEAEKDLPDRAKLPKHAPTTIKPNPF